MIAMNVIVLLAFLLSAFVMPDREVLKMNGCLDFSPISRSINDVAIALTNTEGRFPTRFGLHQLCKGFQDIRLGYRV